jgi:ABC-type polysaccharide/polyol phosphate export permease
VAVYGDLVRYRELFANLFRRDFQAKYRGSALGIIWSLVNPAALMGVYLLFVGVIFDRSGGIPHYPIYLLTGIACWTFFAVSLQTAARSMIDSGELIKKVRFPRQLVAFSVVAAQAVTFAVMLVILIGLSLIFIPGARSSVWLVIPLAILFVGFVSGMSLVIACLNVVFRDIEHILAAALIPWFFLTPILWGVATLPSSAAAHHKLIDVLRWGNFVAPPIDALREAIWLGQAPRAADVLYLAVAAVVSLALGAFVFSRIDDRLAVEL